MSETRSLFESFQSNLTEIEKSIKTIIVRLSDNKQAEIEVEDGNHIRKIWYTDSNGSTGFGYDKKSDSFIGFNNPNGSFLTSREDKTIKNKIHKILNNKINEAVQKDKSLDDDFLNYLLSEIEIDRYGEISYLPDFDDAERYKDLTEEEYNKSVEYLKNLIGNAKFYRDNGKLYIELNDNHTFFDIDNDNVDYEFIGDYLKPYFDAFETDTGVELWQAGRSGRHIIVEYNLENLERYDELKAEQEMQEKAFIEEMNNIGKEDIDEGDSLKKVRKDSKEKGLLTEESDLYVYTDANTYDKEELAGNLYNYKQEAPNLKFRVYKDNDMYFVQFIGTKQDIIDYLTKLGWYSKDEIEELDLIKPYKKISTEKLEEDNGKSLTEAYNPLNTELYMNTWGNYNINGAEVSAINGGWMDIDKAKEFLEAHKDEEPFINDTENCPISVSEYDNPWEVIEHLEKIEELDNVDAFLAILEEHNDNFDEALEIYESGDFTFFSGVDNDRDLGEAWVNMVGGIEGVSNPENYIDEDAYRESWREAAEESVREDNPDIDEDSEEFEDLVEEWLDAVVPEQLEIAISEGSDLSDYFDYEAFGRELNFGGFYYASTGAIETY